MRRIIFVTLASCAFALLSALTGPAQAGDTYGGHHRYVWDRGDCCTRTVIRTVPRVRYLRLVEQLPFCAYCDNPPPRYVADPYWSPVYVAAADVCSSRRIRIADGRGGWVWGVKTTCY